MNDTPVAPKAKKSVALSGVPAGNTALCTVGRTGNDLHYRGYDILDFADEAEFEEVAYLLIHGKLPTPAELTGYKVRLRAMRGLPAAVRSVLECLPASAHPMDVLRTGCSALGCTLPEKEDHNLPGARDIADRLMASFGSMLLYWYHYSHNGRCIEVESDEDSIGGHFLHLLHGVRPSASWVRAMHTSLILYAEHEFNASTFACRVITGTGSDMYSALAGGIGALRGPKHGGANEVAFEVQSRYDNADEAEADVVHLDARGHEAGDQRIFDRGGVAPVVMAGDEFGLHAHLAQQGTKAHAQGLDAHQVDLVSEQPAGVIFAEAGHLHHGLGFEGIGVGLQVLVRFRKHANLWCGPDAGGVRVVAEIGRQV